MEFPASPIPELRHQQAFIEEQPPAKDEGCESEGAISPSILRAKTLELGADIFSEEDGDKVGGSRKTPCGFEMSRSYPDSYVLLTSYCMDTVYACFIH